MMMLDVLMKVHRRHDVMQSMSTKTLSSHDSSSHGGYEFPAALWTTRKHDSRVDTDGSLCFDVTESKIRVFPKLLPSGPL
eukprot:scaffold7101_cov153-Amphora_coffeaeformis.AAC.12